MISRQPWMTNKDWNKILKQEKDQKWLKEIDEKEQKIGKGAIKWKEDLIKNKYKRKKILQVKEKWRKHGVKL